MLEEDGEKREERRRGDPVVENKMEISTKTEQHLHKAFQYTRH